MFLWSLTNFKQYLAFVVEDCPKLRRKDMSNMNMILSHILQIFTHLFPKQLCSDIQRAIHAFGHSFGIN